MPNPAVGAFYVSAPAFPPGASDALQLEILRELMSYQLKRETNELKRQTNDQEHEARMFILAHSGNVKDPTSKGAAVKDVVDLCSSSDEESSGPVAKQEPQRGMSLIVIDDSSDEETTPQKQDVIEIDSSSDDDTPQVQESVARMPSPGTDDDSSDDEQALKISKQRAAERRKQALSQPTTSGSEMLDSRKPAGVPKLERQSKNGSARATKFGRLPHPSIASCPPRYL
jgi:hypothetical protein